MLRYISIILNCVMYWYSESKNKNVYIIIKTGNNLYYAYQSPLKEAKSCSVWLCYLMSNTHTFRDGGSPLIQTEAVSEGPMTDWIWTSCVRRKRDHMTLMLANIM